MTRNPPEAPLRRTTRFRRLLESRDLEFLLEAHNGISARIAEEAGFRALWAGGLCMSAQFGVRDNNEASWTQVLEMLEFMADVDAFIAGWGLSEALRLAEAYHAAGSTTRSRAPA